MKEAAGEANMTVITIVLIAIVLAVGTLIVRQMMGSSNRSACCTSNGGVWNNNQCWVSCDVDPNTGAKTDCQGAGEISTDC